MPDAPTKGTILTRGLHDPKIQAEMEAAARKWRTRRLSDLDRIEAFCRSLDWLDADAAHAQGRELTEREGRAALARYVILVEAPFARSAIERHRTASLFPCPEFERIRHFYDNLVLDLGPELNLGLINVAATDKGRRNRNAREQQLWTQMQSLFNQQVARDPHIRHITKTAACKKVSKILRARGLKGASARNVSRHVEDHREK